MFKRVLVLLAVILFCPAALVWAVELDIVYSADTHAMLYACSCPIEKDGGVARRATLVKQLRAKNSNMLLLDAGAFFAGGAMDEYSQNTELDKDRTLINLKAMELMRYDALCVSDNEFNFGGEFLQDVIGKSSVKFISSNISLDKVLPYLIKDLGGLKVGIIGLTSRAAVIKSGGMNYIEPGIALEKYLKLLKRQGSDLIIVLSRMNEEENIALINSIKGIDVLIAGVSSANKEQLSKIQDTFLLRPSWQGRKLGVLSLTIEGKKIVKDIARELRASDEVDNDKEVSAILPRCFSERECAKEGLVGLCHNPGEITATCSFIEPNKVKLMVISTRDCVTCGPEPVVNNLKNIFPGLDTRYLWYPEKEALDLTQKFKIQGLPVYILDKEVEKEKAFEGFKANLIEIGGRYLLKPEKAGLSYFLNRKYEKNRLDLFVSLYDNDTVQLLEVIKEFNPVVHFLAIYKEGVFEAKNGQSEIEEDLRSLCVRKIYPALFWNYISCRAKNIKSAWWEDCLGQDARKIKKCAQSQEGQSLLEENIKTNSEIGILYGPTYIANNKEVFGSKGIPSAEDLKKVLKQ
ncbi:MAG: hypothetical protein ABIG46_08350 [Candidatus Omnitrophota bacterium]|nr:hypothetical protein [Candidatus Omnitrophota bacterium]